MQVEKTLLNPVRETALKSLLHEVKDNGKIGDVLKDNFRFATISEMEASAASAMADSLEKGDNLGVLTAQSELTAAKILSMQTRLAIEEKRSGRRYGEAEEKVKEILGDDATDPKALR